MSANDPKRTFWLPLGAIARQSSLAATSEKPTAAGQEANWLYTQPGQKWFPWFRVYGPEKAILDKSWRLPDIEMVG
jgi:hypothetical protein